MGQDWVGSASGPVWQDWGVAGVVVGTDVSGVVIVAGVGGSVAATTGE